ncbi:helix-turn-helix transcriptional regulator [Kordiimonas sp. SCSIO 12603]|uniref:helix-turn-helix domain-containing protein n=1 Tax=Kordiimonas sp. SCSIO 12603 TaxID=2829596 RepID=UPI002104EE88|nr:helix-turn-helix transcriptional regulator [Kordiimonas sp. SCSIO 12603]UTW58896.1 helix-turn-helix transcriptional regulator [Kordiimonas sp. SCSIO 12603]
MDINASTVKNARLSRSWTQQHLADACNISVRTVHRVEKFGAASPETIMELCSVLELKPDDLVILKHDAEAEQSYFSSAISSSGITLLIVVAILFGMTMGSIFTYFLLQP